MAKQRSPVKESWALPLRGAKDKAGLLTKELAAKAKVAYGTVVKVLQGSNDVLLRHVLAVANALDIELEITVKQPHVIVEPPTPKKLGQVLAEMILYGDIDEAPWPEWFPKNDALNNDEVFYRCQIAATLLKLTNKMPGGSCSHFDNKVIPHLQTELES